MRVTVNKKVADCLVFDKVTRENKKVTVEKAGMRTWKGAVEKNDNLMLLAVEQEYNVQESYEIPKEIIDEYKIKDQD